MNTDQNPLASASVPSSRLGEKERLPRRVLSIVVGMSLVLVFPPAAPLSADDVDPLDRQLLESLEDSPAAPAESPQTIIPRLLEGTKTAATRLSDGQLDETTHELQTQILADIDALLEQSAPPPQQPPSGSSSQDQQQPSSRQQQDSSGDDAGSGEEDRSDPNAAANESTERSTPGESGTGDQRQRRLGLSTAAWGHLPPKVREELRSAFSEEYLPRYDALVRQYYEALARRRAGER